MIDTSVANMATPFPYLAISSYSGAPLNAWFNSYASVSEGLLVSSLYPYVLDSLGFPRYIFNVASRIEPSCKGSQGLEHSMVNITYNGEMHTYGGAGAGSRDPLPISYVEKLFIFDGSENDYAQNATLSKLREKRNAYSMSDTWVDGRYVDEYNCYKQGAKFADCNTNITPTTGFIYDGSVEPGTPIS
ncbi:MAG: hypothetical protein Q4B70_07395 [Lachnospiraceae bacterium]|nr:hypothetical protein [Lachnospiraceae bacterium]